MKSIKQPYQISMPIRPQDDGIAMWLEIVSNVELVKNYSSKCHNQIIDGVDEVLKVVFYIAGVLLINATVSGFYKNTYDEIEKFGGLWVALGASIYPDLLLSVLVSYFAGRFVRDIIYKGIIVTAITGAWQLSRYWLYREPITIDPFPKEFKRYPYAANFDSVK